MGPWGPGMPVRPDKLPPLPPQSVQKHCQGDCCRDGDTCRCDCLYCDCRYAERLGS